VLHAPGDAIVVTLESRTTADAALDRAVSRRSACVLPTPAPASAATVAEAVRRLAEGSP
jgi:hypothetical protein